MTQPKYQLKATKMDYRYVALRQLSIHLGFNANYKYRITSADKAYHFIGSFNPQDKLTIKILAKWSSINHWDLEAIPVQSDFVERYFPKLANLT